MIGPPRAPVLSVTLPSQVAGMLGRHQGEAKALGHTRNGGEPVTVFLFAGVDEALRRPHAPYVALGQYDPQAIF